MPCKVFISVCFFVFAEFREMRVKHSFFDLVQNPQLACEVTLMVRDDLLNVLFNV